MVDFYFVRFLTFMCRPAAVFKSNKREMDGPTEHWLGCRWMMVLPGKRKLPFVIDLRSLLKRNFESRSTWKEL